MNAPTRDGQFHLDRSGNNPQKATLLADQLGLRSPVLHIESEMEAPQDAAPNKRKFPWVKAAVAATALAGVAVGVTVLREQNQSATTQAVTLALADQKADIANKISTARQEGMSQGTASATASMTQMQQNFGARLKQAEEASYYRGQADGFGAHTCQVINNYSGVAYWGLVNRQARAQTCNPDSSKLHKFTP